MTATTAITILFCLFLKHFIIDFPLQGPYQWKNKGTYGHLGGILHTGLHSIGTFFVLLSFASPNAAIMFAVLDGVVHYHIDWAKMNVNLKMGWKPDTHPEFWILLGLDQFLHTATYLVIVVLLV